MRAMLIRLDDEAARDELAAALASAGCPATAAGAMLEVDRSDETATAAEVSFFLRAWQAAHPDVRLQLVG